MVGPGNTSLKPVQWALNVRVMLRSWAMDSVPSSPGPLGTSYSDRRRATRVSISLGASAFGWDRVRSARDLSLTAGMSTVSRVVTRRCSSWAAASEVNSATWSSSAPHPIEGSGT